MDTQEHTTPPFSKKDYDCPPYNLDLPLEEIIRRILDFNEYDHPIKSAKEAAKEMYFLYKAIDLEEPIATQTRNIILDLISNEPIRFNHHGLECNVDIFWGGNWAGHVCCDRFLGEGLIGGDVYREEFGGISFVPKNQISPEYFCCLINNPEFMEKDEHLKHWSFQSVLDKIKMLAEEIANEQTVAYSINIKGDPRS